MFDIGFLELMLVGVMGLIVLGPERLPKAARTLGLWIGRVRNTISGFQLQIEQEVVNQEIIEKLKNPVAVMLEDDVLSGKANVIGLDNEPDKSISNSVGQNSAESISTQVDTPPLMNHVAAPKKIVSTI